MRQVGLFLAGAPKCGTSAMANFLSQHPQICMSAPKEPNYFNRDLDLPGRRDLEGYLASFKPDAETTVLADASILYLYSKVAARAIHEHAPNARILVMLRDPVDVMHAWHGQMLFTSNETETDFARALVLEPERRAGRRRPDVGTVKHCPELLFYRDLVRFSEQLERFYDVFDGSQIKVVLHEDFKARPREVYREILRFAGVDPDQVPDFKVVNPSKARRFPALHRGLKRVLAEPARRLLPPDLRMKAIRLLDRTTSDVRKRPDVPKELREKLAGELAEETRRLADLIGVSLAQWTTPAPKGQTE